jgi:siroheme synthase-like protein
MNFKYPVFLDLTGKKCLVIGEGYEIASKVSALVDCSARVRYVNPGADPAIQALATVGLLDWEARSFLPIDLDGCFLAISDLEDNSEIFALAEQHGILCNSVDDPANCRFSFGSTHRQGDLTIAISTNGCAPAMAVRLKERLQREIGPEYGELLEILKDVRPEISTHVVDFAARRDFWYRVVDSDCLARLGAGEHDAVEADIRRMVVETIANPSSSTSRSDIYGDDANR